MQLGKNSSPIWVGTAHLQSLVVTTDSALSTAQHQTLDKKHLCVQTGEERAKTAQPETVTLHLGSVWSSPDVHPLGADDASPPARRVEVYSADSTV